MTIGGVRTYSMKEWGFPFTKRSKFWPASEESRPKASYHTEAIFCGADRPAQHAEHVYRRNSFLWP